MPLILICVRVPSLGKECVKDYKMLQMYSQKKSGPLLAICQCQQKGIFSSSRRPLTKLAGLQALPHSVLAGEENQGHYSNATNCISGCASFNWFNDWVFKQNVLFTFCLKTLCRLWQKWPLKADTIWQSIKHTVS